MNTDTFPFLSADDDTLDLMLEYNPQFAACYERGRRDGEAQGRRDGAGLVVSWLIVLLIFVALAALLLAVR